MKTYLALFGEPGKLMISRRTKKSQKHKTNARLIVNTVIRLEKRVWRVAQRRQVDAFAKLVPSDAIMIFQSGIVSQPEYLASMGERTISRYELRNFAALCPMQEP